MDFAVESHFNKIVHLLDKSDKLNVKEFFDQNVFSGRSGFGEVRENLKTQLTLTKSSISETVRCCLEEWHSHTNSTYLGGKVQWRVQKACKPELLTQAWLKFYQILKTFDVVTNAGSEEFSSLHLCEAPGAFITSLNHFLQQSSASEENRTKWRWRATTLNPHYEGNPGLEMVSDDRFIIKTLDNWDFGPDGLGDLKNSETGKHLADLGPFNLVTADGSVDCQDNPGEQENTVASLLACETTTALSALAIGGNFVIKTFTWFEWSSWSLLSLLCHCFEAVTAIKPVCSKEGNSEVYLVCLNFQGLPKDVTSLLWDHYGKPLNVENIPEKISKRILEASTFFNELQHSAIKSNLKYFQNPKIYRSAKMNINCMQNEIASSFLERFDLSYPVQNSICGNTNFQRLIRPAYPWSPDQTHLIRSSLQKMDYSQAKDVLETVVSSLSPVTAEEETFTLPSEIPVIQCELQLKYGTPYKTLTNSRFCAPLLLQLHNYSRNLYCNIVPVPDGINFIVGRLWKKSIWNSLQTLGLQQKFVLNGFNLFTLVDVGILVLLRQDFEQCVLTEVTPEGSTFEFTGFKGASAKLESALICDEVNEKEQQLLEVVPLSLILDSDLHPLVERANQQTVLRLAQATLALLPENRGPGGGQLTVLL
ncbi:cap-specific mRNA (nucleoside-2'-O-)-methyltransferase 2 [Cloeon dipterum]|uniref:cap-specific mRNA (nucleoside-2'-O-)-methyltransferase 2 n=1 Tax=Cloeon dipterum TaxID=197152 RepID=UPI003220046C